MDTYYDRTEPVARDLERLAHRLRQGAISEDVLAARLRLIAKVLEETA